MPELPEVETVVSHLKPHLVNKIIRKVEAENEYERVFATGSPADMNRQICGQKIESVFRRGKYIVIQLGNGFVLVHLRMTGQMLVRLQETDLQRHLTATFHFTDGSRLYFKDYRKFGRIYFYISLELLEAKLGVEPLEDQFTIAWLNNHLNGNRRKMKPLLLDQSFIAGLGNIYVDEALWVAKIHPEAAADSVSHQKSKILHGAIQSILQNAIANKGTTFINFQFGEGNSGEFASQLNVFDRDGQPCPRCESEILKIRVAQRGTHYCPRCQKI